MAIIPNANLPVFIFFWALFSLRNSAFSAVKKDKKLKLAIRGGDPRILLR